MSASATTLTHGSPALTRREKVFTLAGVLLGMLLAALDQTIVATAGPAIQKDLEMPAALYPWITTAYLVASTVVLPIWGKLSDLWGRRTALLAGISVFVLGSLLCAVAPNSMALVVARGIQGLGSASLFTCALTVVADLFAPAERGRVQGLFGAVFGLSSVVGPFVGGLLTDHFGWHWVFLVNLPVGVLAAGFILAFMPPLIPAHGGERALDVAGSVSLAVAVVPLLLALSLGRGEGGGADAATVVALLVVSAAGVVLFLRAERRAASPVLDLSLFRNRAFATGNLASLVLGGGFLGSMVFLPLFMVNVVGLSATSSGMTMMPLTLGLVAGNILSGQLVYRLGRYKRVILGSQALLIAVMAVMALSLAPDATQASVTAKMVLVGLGMGPTIPLFTVAVQNCVAPHQTGVATSAVTFFRQVGSTVGVAVMGMVFASTLGGGMRTDVAAAVASLPPEVQAPVKSAGHADRAMERGPAQRFDGAAVRERIGAMAGTPEVRQARLAAVDHVDGAVKAAFTRATAAVYLVSLLFVLVGFLLTLAMPELPLRGRGGGGGGPAAH